MNDKSVNFKKTQSKAYLIREQRTFFKLLVLTKYFMYYLVYS